MKLQNKVLLDMDGKPMLSNETTLTVALVLMTCALSAPDPKDEKPRTEEEIAARHKVAEQLRNVAENESFDLPFDMAAKLRADLGRMWAVIVAGQVIRLMDGDLDK